MKYKPIQQKTLKQILKPKISYFGYSKKEILNFNQKLNKYSWLWS